MSTWTGPKPVDHGWGCEYAITDGTATLHFAVKVDAKAAKKWLNERLKYRAALEEMADEANNPAPIGDGAAEASWFIRLAEEALK